MMVHSELKGGARMKQWPAGIAMLSVPAALCVLVATMLLAITEPAGAGGAPVRMAYLQSDVHHLALWASLETGLFEEAGVDIEIAGIFRAGPDIMSAFAAGELDMAYVGEAPATTAVANGAARVVAVAQVNTEGSALVVSDGSAASGGWQGLRGKTVCIPGHATVQDFLLKKALKRHGLDNGGVNVMVLKPPEMINALRSGQTDGFIAWEPYPSKAVAGGAGVVLAASGDIWPNHPCCVLVADADFLKAHPDQVLAVVKAHVKATDYINGQKRAAAAIAGKYTGMDLETLKHAVNSVRYAYDLSIEGEKEYVMFLSELGYIRAGDPALFVQRFLNGTFLAEVLGK